MKKRSAQISGRLIFFSVIFFLLLGYPFIHMANKPLNVFGVPLLYFYIMSSWLALIFFLIISQYVGVVKEKRNE
ncbi:MAG: hypothetical protein MH132_11640 [Hydrotalea sp.]|nr:hypothetical protein [Hydrotalea sp.]